MNDLISREAAIEVLSLSKEILSRALDDMNVVGTDREKYSWGLGLIESYISDIKDLPSAQPERPKGEWVECVSSEHWKCNQCGDRAPMYWDDANMSYAEWLSPYCPNCGADMRGKEQDG